MNRTLTHESNQGLFSMKRAALITLTLALPLLMMTAACDDETIGPPPEGTQIFGIGDSVMAFNRSENSSIPEVVGEVLGKRVHNAAVGGAVFTNNTGIDDPGFDIREQYVDGPWELVVLDGGANDLGGECACGACDATLDDIISADGQSGAMPTFVRDITDKGIHVAVMGYYELPADAPDFDGCAPLMRELSQRQSLLAASSELITFVDGSTVVSPANSEAYDPDRVHPSPTGSRLLGTAIAEAVRDVID